MVDLLCADNDIGEIFAEVGMVRDVDQRFKTVLLQHELPLGEELPRETGEHVLFDVGACLTETGQVGRWEEVGDA